MDVACVFADKNVVEVRPMERLWCDGPTCVNRDVGEGLVEILASLGGLLCLFERARRATRKIVWNWVVDSLAKRTPRAEAHALEMLARHFEIMCLDDVCQRAPGDVVESPVVDLGEVP
jgi:hypothetical protein